MFTKMTLNNFVIGMLVMAAVPFLASSLYASPVETSYGKVDYAETKIENGNGFEQQVCVHGIPATIDKPITIFATLYNNIVYKGTFSKSAISRQNPCFTINLGKELWVEKDNDKAKLVWWEELSNEPIGETTFPLQNGTTTPTLPLPTAIIELTPKSDIPYVTERKPNYLRPNDYTQTVCLGTMEYASDDIPGIRVAHGTAILYKGSLPKNEDEYYRAGANGMNRCFDITLSNVSSSTTMLTWWSDNDDENIGETSFVNPLPVVTIKHLPKTNPRKYNVSNAEK